MPLRPSLRALTRHRGSEWWLCGSVLALSFAQKPDDRTRTRARPNAAQPNCRVSTNGSRPGSGDEELDGLLEKGTENVEDKFGNVENDAFGEFSDPVLTLDDSVAAPSVEDTFPGAICEEGFFLDYLAAVPSKGGGILNRLRSRYIARTPRQWLHLDESSGKLSALDDSYEELPDSELLEGQDVEGRYRLDEQAILREQRAAFARRATTTTMDRLVDRVDYIELDGGGGKLGNKISPAVITVAELRVDSRASLLTRRREDAVDEAYLEELSARIDADEATRKLRRVEYTPILLLTVGAQGSGKSKFSLDLVEHGALPWVRINQDTIRLGKRGTKQDCVSKARELMQQGYCVVIDRMNFSVEQRGEFVELSRTLRSPIHAIVFRLPFVENVYNVSQRRGHEGHFEGDSDLHRQIIYYTRCRLFNGGHPKATVRDNGEGFNSVFECRSNEDYAFAFRQWMNIGRKEPDGTRLTVDAWLEQQKPWRIADVEKLRTTEEKIKHEAPWLRHPALPFRDVSDLDTDLPSWRHETVGYASCTRRRDEALFRYLPSRDGPFVASEDDDG